MENIDPTPNPDKHPSADTAAIAGMYRTWFLDYASYVILERAVPYIEDGLKPVQRRILHSMFELEDGRYNKVANIIGNTMKYHPHGDASIGDAMVQIGQKNLLIDTQGNWGNLHTGDSAAAPRYIEARLSKFALEVVFNPKTTVWQLSYDGRNREPVTLPVKFPLLLAMGVEGIAVGLASKILPHNFVELLQASIDVIKGKRPNLMPDFPTGGVADFSKYNEGLRGGRIRVRAIIEKLDKKTLVIKQIPYGTTTTSVIESILAAVEKGKIKIKKVEDNTSSSVEIVINLHPDASQDPDKAIEALYAFTNCEVPISPNACIIEEGRPRFVSVNDMLEISTRNTVDLLKLELEIARDEKEAEWHYCSLEKIFIEKRIYRGLEVCETWDQIIETIDSGLKPYLKILRRPVTHEDMVGLTDLKIKRISRYDSNRAEEKIAAIEEELAKINDNLQNLKIFAINYFKDLLKKYGKGRERQTQIASFETIVASKVIANNQKLFVNREEGFAGFGMKRDEFVCDCSDIDDIIAFTGNGKFMVSRISEKTYMGKDIRHIAIFDKNEEHKIYNLIYQDGKGGPIMVKRFNVSGVTRDKVYDLTKGAEGSRVLYFSISGPENGPKVTVFLKPRPKLKNLNLDINFNEVLIKGRSSIGNVVTKFPIAKIRFSGSEPGVPAPVEKNPAKGQETAKDTSESSGKPESSQTKTQIKLEF